MPAPEGKPKDLGGCPPKYETEEAMQIDIDAYFKSCSHKCNDSCDSRCDKWEPLTITGLAMALDMSTETLRRYGKKDRFCATVTRAKQKVEHYVEKLVYRNGPSTGPQFWLTNNANWKNKNETAHTGPDGGALETVAIDPEEYAKVRKQMLDNDEC